MENNSTKVVTGRVRFCYAHVFEPVTIGDDNGTPKYSVCILIPKNDTKTLSAIKKAIENAKIAGKAKLANNKGVIPSNLKTPLRDGDEERGDDPAYEGMMFINANSTRRPAIVDRDLNAIMEKEEFYSGCYGRASINFFAFAANGNKGIAAGLNNLQKLEDGEMLAGGSTADEDFGGDNSWDDDLM